MKKRKFYKFQSINKHSISALAQRKLWCSNAATLNDPFDFKIVNIKPEDIHALVDKDSKLNSTKIRSVSEQDSVAFRQVAQEKIDVMGITSFTEKNDNLLMWSHYADMHRGICLEFLVEGDPWLAGTLRTVQPANGVKWKGGIHKVKYSKKLPVLDFSGGFWDKNGVMKILLTKSFDWKYEKEWRCIHANGGKLHPYFGMLTGIIFGYRTSNQDKDLIKSLLKEEVQYHDSKLSETEFKVEILPHSS